MVTVVVVVVAVLGQVDLTHPHSEEAEWWSRVQGVLCPAVMTTVWVVAGERAKTSVSLLLILLSLFMY